jgi:hypothetical protein
VRVARSRAVVASAGAGLPLIGAATFALGLLLAWGLRIVYHLGGLLLGIPHTGFLWSLHPPCVPSERIGANQARSISLEGRAACSVASARKYQRGTSPRHSRLLDELLAGARGSLQHWGALQVTMPLMTPT